MGKRGGSNSTRNGPKKAIVGKKNHIDKLIEASKGTSLPKLNLPPRQWTARPPSRQPFGQQSRTYGKQRPPIRLEPKQVVPGIPGLENAEFLILDRRSHNNPEVPLIRLPCEPTVSRALRYKAAGHFPFLKLPGELRNKIYDYVIIAEHYGIEWVNGTQKSKTLTYELPRRSKLYGPHLSPDAAQRRRLLDFHRRRTINQHLSEDDIRPGPTMLLLVCKQISEEAASVFYSKSMFHFHSLGTLRHFLNNLRPATMASIQKLSLKYRAYGNPAKTEHQRFKEKHDRLWENLCWRVADKCSLKQLTLDLVLNAYPVSFAKLDEADITDPGAQWMQPLWAFQDLDIEKCCGRIRCDSQWDTVLEVESWNMRKEILGSKWNAEAENGRDAYGFEKPRKGSKGAKKGMVLTIGMDGSVEGA